MRTSTALLAILVAALGVSAVVLFRRQQALADRLAELESRQPARPSRPSVTDDEVPQPAASTVSAPPVRETAPAAEPEPRRAPAPAPSAAPLPADLSPSLQSAVAKEVDRLMKERGGVWLDGAAGQDPIAVMEKELNLSPAQKLRIQDYWKRRDDAVAKVFGEGFKNPGEHMKKVTEIEEEYDASVRRELDFGQQERYEALKREGRLLNARGAVFRVNVKTEK